MDSLDGLWMVDSAGRCYFSRPLVRRCAELMRQVVPLKRYADPSLKDKKTQRPCFGRSWTSRQAPQTSWRSWSCWWSAPPPVRFLLFVTFRRTDSISFPEPTLINTTLVTLVKSVCATTTSRAISIGARSSMSTNSGVLYLKNRRRA